MPILLRWFYPRRVWAFSRRNPDVYLTFDDGPIPGVTPWVLDLLKVHDAKATFFCIGENIERHPEIYARILAEGHSVGNHSHTHLRGTATPLDTYLSDIKKCDATMLKHRQLKNHGSKDASDSTLTTKLFRPPYGRMTSKQAKAIRKKGYQIVMWDVLSADFDTEISEEKCLQNVLQSIEKGSVVIFHDSIKAEKNLRYALPKVLDFIISKGYALRSI